MAREAVARKSARRGPATTVDTYRDDPLYPRITRAVAAILAKGKVVTPVDVLIGMDLLAPEKLEDWRRGRVPYLERVIRSNLTRLSRLLRILRFHAHDLNLVPSLTVCMRWGKGPKQRLRFTMTGAPRLEEVYARHFVWPGKGPFHPPAPRGRTVDDPPCHGSGESASRDPLEGLLPPPRGIGAEGDPVKGDAGLATLRTRLESDEISENLAGPRMDPSMDKN